jgi:hypothetical protein
MIVGLWAPGWSGLHLLFNHPKLQNEVHQAPATTDQASKPPSGAPAVASTLVCSGNSSLCFSIPICSGSECGVVIKLFSKTDMRGVKHRDRGN